MTVLAVVSGIALGSAIVLLATFFVTRVERYDRLAEWAFVLFAVCAIPTILAVGQLLPVDDPVRVLVTAVGVVGVATVGLGELVVTLHLVDFRRLAPVVTVGFVAFLGWIGGCRRSPSFEGDFRRCSAGSGWTRSSSAWRSSAGSPASPAYSAVSESQPGPP